MPGAIGRLLLAARKNDSLGYVGGVGTGFTQQSSAKLRELLEQMPAKTPAVKLSRKNAVFTKLLLVAEIEYRAWTKDRGLRHPSFKGLRERQDKEAIHEIEGNDYVSRFKQPNLSTIILSFRSLGTPSEKSQPSNGNFGRLMGLINSNRRTSSCQTTQTSRQPWNP